MKRCGIIGRVATMRWSEFRDAHRDHGAGGSGTTSGEPGDKLLTITCNGCGDYLVATRYEIDANVPVDVFGRR